MTLDEAMDALAADSHILPRKASRWSLDHRDEACPRFVQKIDDSTRIAMSATMIHVLAAAATNTKDAVLYSP